MRVLSRRCALAQVQVNAQHAPIALQVVGALPIHPQVKIGVLNLLHIGYVHAVSSLRNQPQVNRASNMPAIALQFPKSGMRGVDVHRYIRK